MTKIERGSVTRTANAWDNFNSGTLIATGPPVALAAASTPIIEVIVQNDPDSAEAVYVGTAFGQHFQLEAGSSLTVPVCDLSLVYVSSAGGTARVNYLTGV